MPKINLGRVKGDPLTWDDLTDEQKLSLKGEKGNTPKVKAGTTTIVEYDKGAKVTSNTTGDVTSFNFQIPVGQKPPFYGAYDTFPETGDPNRTYIDDTVDPRLMYTWDETDQKYVLTGGAGGADGSSIDIPITLPSTGWTGTTAPYSQTVTVPQMREGMTPFLVFSGVGDDAQYAYSLITGYEAGYAQMTFSAADKPQVDIPIILKGVPAQQLEYADNTVVVVVPAEGWAQDENTGRYELTITVEGMSAGANGGWDIVRSGEVLSEAESKIAASITDVIPQDGAIKIVCLWEPGQQYMLKLVGTYTQTTEGTTILAGMQGWFDKVDKLEKRKPDYANAIALENSIASYTAPSDGYIKSNLIRSGTELTYFSSLSVNGFTIGFAGGAPGITYVFDNVFIPVSEGDSITWIYEEPNYCKSISNAFIPLKK